MEMNRTLEDFKGTHDLSNNKLREYCKMAKVCARDGKWYRDLDTKLNKGSAFRVPKDKMKRYPHVRKCMLYAA